MNITSYPWPVIYKAFIRYVLFLACYSFSLSLLAGTHSKSIAIGGHIYLLELDNNDPLIDKLKQGIDGHPPGQHYSGRIAGRPQSWTRLSEIDGRWRGLVSLGGQLLVIDEPVETPETSLPIASAKLADLSASSVSDFEPQSCGVETAEHNALFTANSSTEPHAALAIAESVQFSSLCSNVINGVCMVADMEFAFDLAFQSELGANAMAEAIALINIVEGFYINDFNIAFETLSVEMLSSELVSTTTDSGDLLEDIREEKIAGTFSFIQNSRALLHFVTGRNLDGGTAGIAYVGALCSANWGVGLTEYLGNTTVTAIVMAHELGHNFGASHDGSGNSCGNGFIMQSSVNSSITNFSSCSLDYVTDELESLSNPAQCFNFAVDGAIIAAGSNPSQVNLNQPFDSQYEISMVAGYQSIDELEVTGSLSAAQGHYNTVTLNGSACSISGDASGFNCSLSNPGGSATLDVNATATGASLSLTHTAKIDGSGDVTDVDSSNDQLVANFTVATGTLPNAPTSLVAASSSGLNVDLTWQDNSNNETGFRIERRLQGGFFASLGQVSADQNHYQDTATSAGSSYEYRVFAINGIGDSSQSNIASISIADIPAAPSNLSVLQLNGTTQVELSWTDNAIDERSFLIERRSGSSSFAQIAELSANTTSYVDTSTEAGTSYEYRVFAENGIGLSPASNIVELLVNEVAPLAPSSLIAEQVAVGQVRLSWSDNSNNETHFTLERRADSGVFSILAQLDADTTSYTDASVSAGVEYEYRSFSENSGGVSSASNLTQIVVDDVPNAPQQLSVNQLVNAIQVDLVWQDTSSNELGFLIERRVSSGNFAEIAQVNANDTNYVDTSIVAEQTYEYRVFAFNALGSSLASNQQSVTIQLNGNNIQVPDMPGNLMANLTPNRHVLLTWEDQSSDENGFTLERRENADGYMAIAQLADNVATYTDVNVSANNNYQYRLSAFNSGGASQFVESNEIQIIETPPARPSNIQVTPGENGRVELSWQDNSNNESGFIIRRRDIEALSAGVAAVSIAQAEFSEVARVAANVTAYSDQTNANNVTFEYEVSAFNSAGVSLPSESPEVTVVTEPAVSAPTPTNNSNAGGGGGGNLGWLTLIFGLLAGWYQRQI